MKHVKVKKLHPAGEILSPAHSGDAGYDVRSPIDIKIDPGMRYKLPLGLALEMEEGYVCIMYGKSGRAAKEGLTTIGNVIDASYRGEIHAIILNTSTLPIIIHAGEKVAQLIFHEYRNPEIQYVEELSTTSRGADGFGSSGSK